jgi:hypothetical protein
LHQVLFSLASVTAQLSVGGPLSPEIMAGSAQTAFPYGLRNAAEDVLRLMDDEFVRMVDYVSESFHDLLTGELEMIFDSEGRIESAHDGNTPPDVSDDGAWERNQAPPCVRLEQLREWQ